MATPVLRVVVGRPLSRTFDYLPPAGTDTATLQPGMRLRVPFGRGRALAILVGLAETSEVAPDRLKRAVEILDQAPLLSPELIRFTRRTADYYHHPLGEVMMAALPPALRGGDRLLADTQTRWFATGEAASDLARAPVQASLLARIRECADAGADAAALAAVATHWRAPLESLCRKRLVTAREIALDLAIHGQAVDRPPTLNPDQAAAVQAVSAADGYRCFLLQGVTGSGKTEVYLRLIESQLARQRQCLLLVPEIGLTPQLVARLRRRLAAPMVVFHSGLSDGERARAWRLAAEAAAMVLVGTRSAVFTPLARPGLILVDEEHDPSFKQQDGFRYHARDLAVLRASQLGVPIVLGTATPSLETFHNATAGRYEWHRLRSRATGRTIP